MIRSIAVVDDSIVQCEYAVQLCGAIYPEVDIRWFYRPAEALDALRESVCDLVVTDLEMPIMDGVQLSEFIASEKLAKSIVICSSKDQKLIESVGVMCESNGLHVSGVISKPVTTDSLIHCFRKYHSAHKKCSVTRNSSDHGRQFSKADIVKGINERQFEFYYQPKLSCGSLLMKGMEALARWKHPDFGYISPVDFIPLVEQWGLIDELTFALFDAGLDYVNKLERKGFNLTTSFNFSPRSIGNTNFCDKIDEIVASKSCNPKSLIFEITENYLAGNVGGFISSLARLRLHGYGISIDDFGSQYANYELLSKLPITELKVDRSMVTGVSDSCAKKDILESVVKMASKLNLSTVTEGIETYEDYKCVESIGVDVVQGFYFAKPMAQKELVPWVNSQLAMLREKIKSY